ncbi:hypothetical protein F4860DRAFT_491164 [Xylaria cubensis]|nr:hypothetical protein F4860DRAFT_491164 [Xylaria cubensis]
MTQPSITDGSLSAKLSLYQHLRIFTYSLIDTLLVEVFLAYLLPGTNLLPGKSLFLDLVALVAIFWIAEYAYDSLRRFALRKVQQSSVLPQQ